MNQDPSFLNHGWALQDTPKHREGNKMGRWREQPQRELSGSERQESSPGVLLGPPQAPAGAASSPWFVNSPPVAVGWLWLLSAVAHMSQGSALDTLASGQTHN